MYVSFFCHLFFRIMSFLNNIQIMSLSCPKIPNSQLYQLRDLTLYHQVPIPPHFLSCSLLLNSLTCLEPASHRVHLWAIIVFDYASSSTLNYLLPLVFFLTLIKYQFTRKAFPKQIAIKEPLVHHYSFNFIFFLHSNNLLPEITL